MKLKDITKPTGIEYNDDKHSYTRISDGVSYFSCTKIAGLVPKEYLQKWTTKENYLYVKDNWDINKVYTESEKNSLLLKAKDIYKEKSSKAMKIGTSIHDWIEQHIAGKDTIKPEGYEWTIDEFLNWEKSNIEEWQASEFLVASHEHTFAGRLDAVAKFKNGLIAIVDFKTSNNISSEYFLQTAGYWIALKEMGVNIDQRKILMIPKNTISDAYDKEKRRYFKKENHVECVTVMSDLEMDIKTFLSFRTAMDWVNLYCKE